jgi:hypothetical protein
MTDLEDGIGNGGGVGGEILVFTAFGIILVLSNDIR